MTDNLMEKIDDELDWIRDIAQEKDKRQPSIMNILREASDKIKKFVDFQDTPAVPKLDRVPRTLKECKEELELLRQAHNKDCENSRNRFLEEDEHRMRVKMRDNYRKRIIERMLRGKFAKHVLTHQISFQASRDYCKDDMEANHKLGDELEKKFPQGMDDSEIGQGWFHINERYLKKVLRFLEGKTSSVNSRKRDDPWVK